MRAMSEKIFIDTEFIEDGKTIELISLGACRLRGEPAEFYACNSEVDLDRACDWVKGNVVPRLPPKTSDTWMPRLQIADRFRVFCGKHPEFWGYYSDYDWVVICQMYGCMVDLPKGWPMYCRDIRQLADGLEIKNLPRQESEKEHNALSDARWNLEAYQYIWDGMADRILNFVVGQELT